MISFISCFRSVEVESEIFFTSLRTLKLLFENSPRLEGELLVDFEDNFITLFVYQRRHLVLTRV